MTFVKIFFQKFLKAEEDSPSIMIWVILVLVILFFTWASISYIDQVTRAPGQIVASSRTQIIQSSDGGVIQEILVKEGDKVEKGQLLIKLDPTKVEAAYLETRSKAVALRATFSRLRAEISGGEPKFSSDINNYPQFKENQLMLLKKRRAAIKADLDKNWAVVAEAIQTILRREGYPKPYEALKDLTRTNAKITQESMHAFIDRLNVSDEIKKELKGFSPHNYTGF